MWVIGLLGLLELLGYWVKGTNTSNTSNPSNPLTLLGFEIFDEAGIQFRDDFCLIANRFKIILIDVPLVQGNIHLALHFRS